MLSIFKLSVETADGQKQLTALGKAVDKVGKTFDALVKKSQSAMGSMSSALAGFTKNSMTALGKEIDKTGKAFETLMRKTRTAMGSMAQSVGGFARSELQIFSKGLLSAFRAGAVNAAYTAITSLGGALYDLVTGQKEAEARTARYQSMVDALGGSAEQAREEISKLKDGISRMGEAELQANLSQALKDVEGYSKDLNKLLTKNLDPLAMPRDYGQFDNSILNKAIRELQAGELSAKAFREEVYKAFNAKEISFELIPKILSVGFGFASATEEADLYRGTINNTTFTVNDLGTAIEALNTINSVKTPRSFEEAVLWLMQYTSSSEEATNANKKAMDSLVQAAMSWLYLAHATAIANKEVDKAIQIYSTIEHIQKRLASMPKGGGNGGSSAARDLAREVRSLDNEIAHLTLTQKEYQSHQFGQKLREAIAAGVPATKLLEYSVAHALALNKKSFDDASEALREFERQYQQAFRNSGQLEQSIMTEMDNYRAAADAARQTGAYTEEEYTQAILRINELQHDKMLQSARDAASGAERAFRNYADSATDMAKNTETFVSGTFDSIGQAFQLTTDGMKFSWKSAMDSILNQSFQMFAVNPILGGISKGLEGLFSSSPSIEAMGNLLGGKFGITATSGSAHGNAFSAGTGLSAYRNSIVTRPTLFAYAHGGIPGSRIGLMGEKAGSPGEVIAPLFRASNGDLGVKSVGGGASEVSVFVDVHNNSNEQVSVRESRGSNGMPRLDVLIGEVERGIANNIFSGRSPIARAMDRTRGTSSAMSLYWK